MYLAQGLQASSRTKLSELGLNSVGMGNAGFNSLAEAIRSGALSECSRLCACGITGFINVIPFTNGLRSGGLEKLTELISPRLWRFWSNLSWNIAGPCSWSICGVSSRTLNDL